MAGSPFQSHQQRPDTAARSNSTPPSTVSPKTPRSSTLGMRRSLDFGSSIFGSNSHSRSNTMGSAAASNGGSSRFGTVAGLSGNSGGVQSSSSTLGTGSNKRGRSSFGMSAGGLAALFGGGSNGTSSRTDSQSDDKVVEESGERELMQAVEAAEAEDAAWEIRVEEAKQDGLFLFSPSPSTAGSATKTGGRMAKTARMLSPRKTGRPATKRNEENESSPSPSISSAASSDAASPLFVLYVTTGTASLTLYRTAARLAQLDGELRSLHPNTLPADRPALLRTFAPAHVPRTSSPPPSQQQSGHTRRRSVLATLTRTFGTSSSKRASPVDRSMSPLSANSQTASMQGASSVSDIGAIQENTPASQVSAAQLSQLSDYLSTLSTIAVSRQSEPWISFFSLGKDDSSSAHLEKREPKRIKSEGSLLLSASSPHKTALYGESSTGTDAARPINKDDVTAAFAAANPDDSGIGDLSLYQSTTMRREASTATSKSAMSLFVENDHEEKHGSAAADGTPKGDVGDPEVLAFMHSISEEQGAASESDGQPEEATKAGSRSPEDAHTLRPTLESVNTATANEPILAELQESATIDEEDQIPLTASTAVGSVSVYAAAQSQVFGSEVEHGEEEREHRGEATGLLTPASVEEEAAAKIEEELEAHMSKIEQEVEARRQERLEQGKQSSSVPKDLQESTMRDRTQSSAKSSSRAKKAVGIEDFEILRVLGKGCAGKVLLARKKESTALYAIKAIHKHHVLAHRELAHTLTEQSILKKMATQYDNPFVVKMTFSFQNKDNLFLVLDFHPGGDLATQLSRWGRLGKDRTRFYAAEIVQGLEGLHEAGVIYRDLKPENILLAADGHIILTDFGLSKQFPRLEVQDGAPSPSWLKDSKASSLALSLGKTQQDESTSTFCGTAEYLAPEVLLGNTYSYPVDMWSLGTMIYEMLLGVTPFYSEDHGTMYRRVLHEQLSFGSSDYLDGDTRALLRGLLEKEPEFRMTTKRVKKSKYFEAIDWEFVQHKRYIPPFIPALSAEDPEDTQNFDDVFLTMDLGFIDSDDEEDKEKVRNSGKEPDKPFDEHGRDVFENYGFAGKVSDEDDEQEQAVEEQQEAQQEEGAKAQPEEEPLAGSVERRVESSDSANSSPSFGNNTGRFKNDTDEQDDYDTGVTSASVTDDDQSKHGKDTSSHLRVLSSGLASLAEDADIQHESPTSMHSELPAEVSEEKQEESQEPESVSPRMSLEYVPRNFGEHSRNSVELPRRSIETPGQHSENEGSRHSDEADDWDVVESMNGEDFAPNGAGRKRLIAGPTLFAKGVVDKYRLQLKPSTRAGTPTRSYTSRTALNRLASRGSSSANLNQLSPSPSVGGVSKPPSIEASPTPSTSKEGQKQGPRYRAPKLLRASTEWMSSSLPSSPTPRFRIKGSKRSVNPAIHALGSNLTVESMRAATPDSNATLPLEASNAALQPLTRQTTREQPEDENGQQAEERRVDSPIEMAADKVDEEKEEKEKDIRPKTTKIKRFTLDPTKMGSLFQTRSNTSA